MPLKDEEVEALVELVIQTQTNMPVLLSVYLRGAGKRALADRFTGLRSIRAKNHDWYCQLINEAWETGELPEALAVSALIALATHVLMDHHGKAYVVDPTVNPESQAEFVKVFKTEARSPRMAALMEKSPTKAQALERQGQILLLGNDMEEVYRWYEQRRQHSVAMSVLGRR